MNAKGWRNVWHKWHYFKDGSSLCNKFSVSIIGGTEPRRPWRQQLSTKDLQWPVCGACKQVQDS